MVCSSKLSLAMWWKVFNTRAVVQRLNRLKRAFTAAGVFILIVSLSAVFILFAEFVLLFSLASSEF